MNPPTPTRYLVSYTGPAGTSYVRSMDNTGLGIDVKTTWDRRSAARFDSKALAQAFATYLIAWTVEVL
jgi:hypothetical protein